MLPPWAADESVVKLFTQVKEKYHLPRLEEAEIAVCFQDSKPFKKGTFNWGKVRRFQPVDKLWHRSDRQYDFLIILSSDAWNNVLTMVQREALADLHLTRCSVDYEPVREEVTVKGIVKHKIVKDDYGRVEFTNEIKRDKETGEPKWKILTLDLPVFSGNVSRYGLWCSDLNDFGEIIQTVKTETVSTEIIQPILESSE